MAKTRPRRPAGGRFRLLKTLLVWALVILVAVPPVWVAIYRFAPPPITLLMIERSFEGRGLDHRWTPIGEIAPQMVRAVIASEDSGFCRHHGFDLHAIDKAIEHNQARPGRVRGGSTISQQTAKNVFLWPDRSWVRKGFEAWFTVLIEAMWGKRRIMEVYLNTVETGPGLYGVEAASRRYFGADAHDLTDEEAARLAAILPSPLKWRAIDPGPYVRLRTGRIDARSQTVERGGMAGCVLG
jgi:monofunctional biosynthetic peptidoglycan transglycosylase